MKKIVLALAAGMFSLAAGFLQPGLAQEAADPAAGGTVILREDDVWRLWAERGFFRLDPAVLKDKAECEKWQFTDRWMKGVENGTKNLLKGRDIDWSNTDWRDKAMGVFYGTPYGAMFSMFEQMPPPRDWWKADFDDTGWNVVRNSPQELAGHPYPMGNTFNWNLYYRGYFKIPEGIEPKDLVLNVTFRGGCRVFANGQEVVRKHLSQGEITPDTVAEGYPEAAYRALLEETCNGRSRPSIADIRTRFIKGVRCLDDRYAEYRLPPWSSGGETTAPAGGESAEWLNREGWDRIWKLRDRKSGAITIPAKLLVKGRNSLAVEIRGGYHHPIVCQGGWNFSMSCNTSWAHCELLKLELKDPAGIVPSARLPGAGLQVWAEDMHSRLYNTDYRPAEIQNGAVRMAGALNGTFSGMAVVWCEKGLSGLKAAPSDLKHTEKEASIAAGEFRIAGMTGEPMSKFSQLGESGGAGRGGWPRVAQNGLKHASTSPYSPLKPGVLPRGMEILFYDHIGSDIPDKVPPKTAQPLWVSLKIPANAVPGLYKGSIRIEADGQPPRVLPVEVEVIGWRIPDPREFQTDITLEQHPYAVANQYLTPEKLRERIGRQTVGALDSGYAQIAKPDETPSSIDWLGPVAAKLPLWSDEHFKYLEASFKQLSRVGNDLLYVPVLERTEFGNWQDCIIKWIRKKDGTMAFDYTRLDRYLDLAEKYLGKPRVICFVIMHCCKNSPPPVVPVFDEASGKTEDVAVGFRENPFKRYGLFLQFASDLLVHMKAKGLEKSVYWGHGADQEPDPSLMTYFREMFPDHYWACSGHNWLSGGAGGGGHSRDTVRYFASIYGAPMPIESLMGWKTSYLMKGSWSRMFQDSVSANPEGANSVAKAKWQFLNEAVGNETFFYPHCPRDEVYGLHPPIRWRTITAISLHRSYSGLGRMGFDGWNYDWLSGFYGLDWGFPGRPCHMLSWPGKDGAEPSARFEALIEGVQEAEARIFMEQAIDRKLLPPDAAAEARAAIRAHMSQAMLWPQLRSDLVYDYLHPWQEASRGLYKAAARVSGLVGLDIARTDLVTEVAALGKTPRSILVRNWTKEPRAWKAVASEPWLALKQTEGTLQGFQEVPFELDGRNLKPGKDVTGTITVTDTATGNKNVLTVGATVGDPVDLKYDHPHFNVQIGRSETREFRVVNRAATEQDWKLTSPVSWIKVEPSVGKLQPGADLYVKLTATPPDQEPKTHENTLRFQAAGGMVNAEFVSKTFVMMLFKEKEDRAMPLGRIVKIEEMEPKRFTYHVNCARGTVIRAGAVGSEGSLDSRGAATRAYTMPGVNRANCDRATDMVLLIGKERFSRGLWAYPHHESTWNLEGSKIIAFSAFVGVTDDAVQWTVRDHLRRVNFEVWVDGKPRVQTGLMKVTDPARYITVEGLEGAKEIKLVSRLDSDKDDPTFLVTWADANFYEKYDKKDEVTGEVTKKWAEKPAEAPKTAEAK